MRLSTAAIAVPLLVVAPSNALLVPHLTSTTDSLGTLLGGLVDTTIGALTGTLGVTKSFDYIVVGGGTAGNTLAYRLAAAGNTVALVEGGLTCEAGKPGLGPLPIGDVIGVGANPLDILPLSDYGILTTPQTGAGNRSIHYAQGKCLGGSSQLNFMIHHRPSRGALDMWADAVGDDSYRFDAFYPYFLKSFSFTPPNSASRLQNGTPIYNTSDFSPAGQGGPVQVTYPNFTPVWSTWAAKGLQAIGMSVTDAFNSGYLSGFHYAQTTIRPASQERSSSADFIYKATNEGMASKLTVYLQARANKVLFDRKKRATGVEVSGADLLTYQITAKKEVILSAGVAHSPQLLMLSGIGPAAQLKALGINVIADRPGVGQNLTDHTVFGPSYEVNLDTFVGVLGNPVALATSLAQYVVDNTGPLTSNIAEFLAWERVPSSMNLTQATRDAMAKFPADWPNIEYFPAAAYIGQFDIPWLQQPKDGKQYTSILGALVSPLSRGTVTLASADPADPPLLNPNWFTHPADIEMGVAIYRRIREIYNTAAVRSVRANNAEYWPGLDVQTDEQIIQTIRGSIMAIMHGSVTNRMGRKDDPNAVVDSLARVIGVSGLRVVDASSMALLPPGHPQAVIYAFAEKIADAIIQGTT